MKYIIEIPNDGTIIMNQYGWIFHNNDAVAISMRIEGFEPVVQCKDCKWKRGSERVRFADVRPFPDDFCSRAERRTDD